MFRFKGKKSSLFIAGAVAVLALGSFVFVFLSTQKVYSEIFEASSSVSLIEDDKFRKDTVTELIIHTNKERALVDSYFVAPDGVVDFIEQIEALGLGIGAEVEVKSVKTVPIKSEKELEFLEITLSATGNWRQNLSFFTKLENLPYKIEIKNALVEKGRTGDNPWSSEYIVSVLKLI